MRNKVLFINPPLSYDSRVRHTNHQFPLGFLYMASVLEKNNFVVKILDCPLYYKLRKKVDDKTIKFGLFPNRIEKIVTDFKPDIVGVSCSFSMFELDSFEIINLVKKIDKNIITLVGGAHSSSNPEFVLRNKNIDLAVIGEGELTCLEIAQAVRDKKDLSNIRGTALILNNKLKINPSREPIHNLDDFEPAWHLVDFKEYFKHPDNYSVLIRAPSVNIITSRGCPGNCVFCSVQTVWGRKWRAISAKKVVEQIEYLVKKYKLKHFRINDDNLTLDKKRVMEICNEIIKRKLNIRWDTPGGVAFWTLDKKVLTAMKKSGYYRITFGIESGSKNTQQYIGKNIELKKVDRIIDYCHELGLWVASFFIIGFPFETKDDIKDTMNYIANSKINFPFLFVAQPYPGTKMYEDFKNSGFLKHGLIGTSHAFSTKYNTKYFTPKQLNSFRKKTYIKFYLTKMLRYTNPNIFYKEFLSKIRTIEDLKYTGKVMKSLITDFLY